jgi:pimeloyl-ACP methyl ester carboxylesterase
MAVDATMGIVDVVERMHRTIQLVPAPLGKPKEGATRGITGFVYRSIRGSTRLIGRGLDASLAPLADLLPEGETTAGREAFVSAVNGTHGDYLARTGNPLAISMSLRHQGRPVSVTCPQDILGQAAGTALTGKLLVLAHGLCMNDLRWNREGFDHGAALADEFGYTPLYLRYNSGRRVGENGREFAALLEALVAHWPCPVEELTIIGHSMGGLVARSACHYGGQQGHAWLGHLRRLVFLGTPHHGSPVERGSRGLLTVMDLSPYSAPLTRIGKSVSAGIQDLRHGAVKTEGNGFARLPRNVRCYAAAATLGARRSLLADRLVGDGLVPLDSALGRHPDRSRALGLPPARRWIGYEMGHLELLHRPEVYSQLRAWLQEPVGTVE